MTTPVATPEHRAPRRTGKYAAVLEAPTLIAAPLLTGTASPAMADDSNTYLRTEQEVFDFISRSVHLNRKEGIKGYPVQGQDSQEVKLADVEQVYPHDQALRDIPATLGSRFNLPPTIPTESQHPQQQPRRQGAVAGRLGRQVDVRPARSHPRRPGATLRLRRRPRAVAAHTS